MKKSYPLTVRQIIDRVISETGAADQFLEQRACYMWPEIVGPGVNRFTTRRYVEKGVMHVYIASASLKNELMLHRSAIVARMNGILKKDVISEIIIH